MTAFVAPRAFGVVAADDPFNPNVVVPINLLVGAERFYSFGFFGFNSFIANVEAGHVWNGHEATSTLPITYVNDPSIGLPNDINGNPQYNFDIHATAVGFAMTGLGPFIPDFGYYYYQFGMAPGAALASTAIASEFHGDGSFEITPQSFAYGYKAVMQDGVPRELAPGITFISKVDIVNSSWGFDDPSGSSNETKTIDALAFANHQTVTVAAGNHTGPFSSPVSGPASGYNIIAVAALEGILTSPIYSQPASFSNAGPNDFFNPKTNTTTTSVRARVDISAPGTELILAAYTGNTGTNTGEPPVSPLPTDIYLINAAGTSFASPTVAGGAALVVDVGYAAFGGGESIDGRVVKAVLLNSASKVPGWTNNTILTGGVLKTSQGLDLKTGAGALNLDRAFDQYVAGTTNLPGLGGGNIQSIGWDYGQVSAANPIDYVIDRALIAGETLTATLNWFVNRAFDPITLDASDVSFDDLDLQVWKLDGSGVFTTLIAESGSTYNNTEHLFFEIPQGGTYGLRVLLFGNNYDIPGNTPLIDDFGLAWSVVPEPAGAWMLAALSFIVMNRKRRRSSSVFEC